MGDFGTVDAVLHHQHLQLAHVVDQELLEAVGEHMAGALVRSVTDVWHQVLTLEATAHSVVNTFRLTPVGLQTKKEDSISKELTLPVLQGWQQFSF